MRYKLLSLGLIILLIFPLALAGNLPLKFDISGDLRTEPGGLVQINIGVTNKDSVNHTVLISTDPFVFLSSSKFKDVIINPTRLRLTPGGRKEILATLRLKKKVFIGDYYSTYLEFKVMGLEGKKIYPLTIRAISPKKIISLKTSMPESIVPGSAFDVDVSLTNKINNLLPNVKVELKSDLLGTSMKKIKLYAFQDKTERFSFKLPENTLAGDYDLTFNVYSNDELIASKKDSLKIEENIDVKEKSNSEKSFFKEKYILTKINRGNSKVSETFILPLSKFKRYFASYNYLPEKQDNKNLYWDLQISPGEVKEVYVVVNFVWLYVSLFSVLALILIILFILSRKVRIKKEILKISEQKDGTVKLKILIYIKNRSHKNIKHVNIVDFLPIVMHPKISYGLLKPSKVHHSRKGIKLYWDLNELIKGEERIISYQVQTKLSIIGKLTLPPALIRFKTKRGRLRQFKSKSVSFHAGI